MIFKAVRDGRPYPEHGLTLKQWAEIPPRPLRLDQLITTKRELALDGDHRIIALRTHTKLPIGAYFATDRNLRSANTRRPGPRGAEAHSFFWFFG